MPGKTVRTGIIGAGSIAEKLADTIRSLKDVSNYAIASRDREKARSFAGQWGFETSYGSYEELLADDKVDLVYIALPHSHHYQWTMEALHAGKHVLCEKAFAVNAAQAEEMITLSREKKLLLTEAIWTRYMPSAKLITDLVKSEEIGQITTVSSNLGYRNYMKQRLQDPALAGGCVLDLTIYTLHFSDMILGHDIKRIAAAMVPTDTGVDG